MIVPAIFKIEKINTHKPANCNYICSIDIYNDLFVVNLFDKKEQRVIFNTKGEHREEIIKFVDEEYGCNNIEYIDKVSNILFEESIEEDEIITSIITNNINKIPSIKLHVKRVAQVFECLDRFNSSLELEAKFDKKNKQTIIYLYTDDSFLNKQQQAKIVYNFLNGIFTYSFNNNFITSSYFLDSLFQRADD